MRWKSRDAENPSVISREARENLRLRQPRVQFLSSEGRVFSRMKSRLRTCRSLSTVRRGGQGGERWAGFQTKINIGSLRSYAGIFAGEKWRETRIAIRRCTGTRCKPRDGARASTTRRKTEIIEGKKTRWIDRTLLIPRGVCSCARREIALSLSLSSLLSLLPPLSQRNTYAITPARISRAFLAVLERISSLGESRPGKLAGSRSSGRVGESDQRKSIYRRFARYSLRRRCRYQQRRGKDGSRTQGCVKRRL